MGPAQLARGEKREEKKKKKRKKKKREKWGRGTNCEHGFKNRTGPAGSTGSTGDRCPIRSGSLKKPKN